ncbi:MAG: RagB/SusD family nutrient uptake outer membrane protein [Rikenellaceae bacterium]
MKNIINRYLSAVALTGALLTATSCNDALNIEPSSQITPENYLNEESQLGSYTIAMYTWIPNHKDTGSAYGMYGADSGTDNQVAATAEDMYLDGEWKVLNESSSSEWEFERMYNVNYFLDDVLPKWKAGTISGSEDMIEHYIGEAYFLRALAYFEKLKEFGDFPIVRHVLNNDADELTAAAQRAPRNEVARFIISDLDSASMLLSESAPDGNGNRLSKPVAQLYKSRVALFEATWLQNFAGTAFVPNGQDWPGAEKSYNSGYSFPSGSLEGEIKYFLEQAVESAAEVAESAVLTSNNGITPQPDTEENPYFSMYATADMSGYPEVLLWRQFSNAYGTGQMAHAVNCEATRGNGGDGLTRGLVMQFLDINGLPWYASGSLFTDDSDITKLRENRDQRISLFLKEPNQENLWYNLDLNAGANGNDREPNAPPIYESSVNEKYTTGYCARKGLIPDRIHHGLNLSFNAAACFRSAEAMLNYMEASYLLYGTLDAKATKYWTALRERAGITAPIQTTIDAIDISKEAEFDWAAYSAGQLLTDNTLFAIRKERRSEYMCEGMRHADLKRWRSMDQLITTPYNVEGMKLWGDTPNYDRYTDSEKALIISGAENTTSNVSESLLGDYLQPHRVRSNSLSYNGLTWKMAHYLSPIEILQIRLTSDDATVENGSLYQNPYWPTSAGSSAQM